MGHTSGNGLDRSDAPFYRWFPDGRLNTCFNAVDRHVLAGRGDQNAIIYDSPITGAKSKMTLLNSSKRLQTGWHVVAACVEKGDRVIIYMPMIPEAIVAMLGCARLGAVHSVVFGGFAAAELAKRVDDARRGDC